MTKGKKIILTLLADFLLLGLLIWSIKNMVTPDLSPTLLTISKLFIIATIPTIYVISFMTFTADKYSYENMLPDEEDTEQDTSSDMEPHNKTSPEDTDKN